MNIERPLSPNDDWKPGEEAEFEERKQEVIDEAVTDIATGDTWGRHSLEDVVDTLASEKMTEWLLKLRKADEKDLWAVRREILDEVDEQIRLYVQPLDLVEERVMEEMA